MIGPTDGCIGVALLYEKPNELNNQRHRVVMIATKNLHDEVFLTHMCAFETGVAMYKDDQLTHLLVDEYINRQLYRHLNNLVIHDRDLETLHFKIADAVTIITVPSILRLIPHRFLMAERAGKNCTISLKNKELVLEEAPEKKVRSRKRSFQQTKKISCAIL